MLGIFPGGADGASSSAATASSRKGSIIIQSQLEALQRIQAQQAATLQHVEARIAESFSIKSSAEEDWAWNPQLQTDLEQRFERIRSVRHRKRALVKAMSSASTTEAAASRQTATMRESQASDADASPRQRLTSSAGRLVATWARAKAFGQSTAGRHEAKNAIRETTNGAQRNPLRLPVRTLRSSWLYRQRTAGRLSRRDMRRQPCGILCGPTACKWLPILPPDSFVCRGIDVITTLAVVYIATFTPLQVAFYRIFDTLPWHLTNLATEGLFVLNILLRFRRGFNHDGVYVSDPHFIALHYFRGHFTADAIASFPYAWILGIRIFPDLAPRDAYHRLLPLLRCVRIIIPLFRSAGQHVTAPSGSFGLNPGVTRVLKLLILFAYTCHWIGCMWWTVGELEQDGLLSGGTSNQTVSSRDPDLSDSWGPSEWLRETQHVSNQYAHALLWGVSMMTGFVPFDVVPSAFMEVFVTVLALCFGMVVNTTIISSTTSALQSISFKSSRVVDKMDAVSQYMRHKRVPPELARRITAFYEYQLSPQRSSAGGHEMGELPPMLAMELILHTHQELFRECPIFTLIPPPTALSLVEHFEPVVFVPDEIVIHEGGSNAALFVINRGLVNVWTKDKSAPNSKRTLTTLTDNDFFGEQTLLATINRDRGAAPPPPISASATCQCISYCDMFRLSAADFTTVLQKSRMRRGSFSGDAANSMANVLSDAADQRNSRADNLRKRSLMWAAATKDAIRRRQQERGDTPPRRSPSLRRRISESFSPTNGRKNNNAKPKAEDTIESRLNAAHKSNTKNVAFDDSMQPSSNGSTAGSSSTSTSSPRSCEEPPGRSSPSATAPKMPLLAAAQNCFPRAAPPAPAPAPAPAQPERTPAAPPGGGLQREMTGLLYA